MSPATSSLLPLSAAGPESRQRDCSGFWPPPPSVEFEGVRAKSWAALSTEGTPQCTGASRTWFREASGSTLGQPCPMGTMFKSHQSGRACETPAEENNVPSFLPTGQTCWTCWPKWQDQQDRTQTEKSAGLIHRAVHPGSSDWSKAGAGFLPFLCLRSSRHWLHTKLCVSGSCVTKQVENSLVYPLRYSEREVMHGTLTAVQRLTIRAGVSRACAR